MPTCYPELNGSGNLNRVKHKRPFWDLVSYLLQNYLFCNIFGPRQDVFGRIAPSFSYLGYTIEANGGPASAPCSVFSLLS